MARQFNGKIALDIRDSTPDWDAFLDQKAPKDAPNVLVILYDDTGCAAWSTYGGRINMPTLDRLAGQGLTYSQWHTTSVCSPTRSTLLTGRNHHQNGFGTIAESAAGFPGYAGHIPPENATIATVLRDAGWSTFWVGKNHNVPVDAFDIGANRKHWPLGLGYDRFYGFIGGETNQWYPELIEDNHFVEQPYSPEDGYHFSKDIADKAIGFIRDTKQSRPDKPWYMWYCPGANHAPHHAPKEYIEKYKGQFDDGYEAYREWVLARMIEKGVLPANTDLTELNPMEPGTFIEGDSVRPWASLSEDEKTLFSRMAEVYAAYSEYTDVQIGRVIDYLEESGQLENTLIFYCADNGASGEGSPNGSVNENRFFNGYPDDIESNLAMIDKLGSPETYNHYPTGWAVAFSTPYRMFKRYSQYAGGTADPMVIHWPKGFKARGEIRDQYHHCTDVVPTILECCGLTMPDVVDGVRQTPMAGVSMRYSFDDADAPTRKETQYYEMLSTRGLWHNGLEGVDRTRAHDQQGRIRRRPLATVSHRCRPLRGARPGSRASGKGQGTVRVVAGRSEEEQRPAAQRLWRGRDSRAGVQGDAAGGRPLYLLPRHQRSSGGLGRQNTRGVVQDPRRGRVHESQPGRDRLAGFTIRRIHDVRQGWPAAFRLQLPRHRAGAKAELSGARVG